MQHTRLSLASLFAVAVVVAGCASTQPPANTISATADCRDLGIAIANAETEKQAAREKESGAWKAIVPFAVIGRYASGKAAGEAADKRLDKLRATSSQRGCTGPGA